MEERAFGENGINRDKPGLTGNMGLASGFGGGYRQMLVVECARCRFKEWVLVTAVGGAGADCEIAGPGAPCSDRLGGAEASAATCCGDILDMSEAALRSAGRPAPSTPL